MKLLFSIFALVFSLFAISAVQAETSLANGTYKYIGTKISAYSKGELFISKWNVGNAHSYVKIHNGVIESYSFRSGGKYVEVSFEKIQIDSNNVITIEPNKKDLCYDPTADNDDTKISLKIAQDPNGLRILGEIEGNIENTPYQASGSLVLMTIPEAEFQNAKASAQDLQKVCLDEDDNVRLKLKN